MIRFSAGKNFIMTGLIFLITATAVGSVASANVLTFVTYKYIDPMTGIEVFRLLIPKGWKAEGRIAWSANPAFNLIKPLRSVPSEKGDVRLFHVLFFLLPSVFRHAHAAACLAAILAEGAVRAGVLLKRGLFIHTFPVYANLSERAKANLISLLRRVTFLT